jgi:hypothetical protein
LTIVLLFAGGLPKRSGPVSWKMDPPVHTACDFPLRGARVHLIRFIRSPRFYFEYKLPQTATKTGRIIQTIAEQRETTRVIF